MTIEFVCCPNYYITEFRIRKPLTVTSALTALVPAAAGTAVTLTGISGVFTVFTQTRRSGFSVLDGVSIYYLESA